VLYNDEAVTNDLKSKILQQNEIDVDEVLNWNKTEFKEYAVYQNPHTG